MMARKNRIKKSRHQRALSAQHYLMGILEEPKEKSEDFLKNVSYQLWNISTRHRIGLPLRGQKTKNNSRTKKGKRKTVANKKVAIK